MGVELGDLMLSQDGQVAMRRFSLSVLFMLTMRGLNILGPQDPTPNQSTVPKVHLEVFQRHIPNFRYSEDEHTTTVEFMGTWLTPKAEGQARIETSSAGIKIEAHVQGLGPAEKIDPEQLTYVLWAMTTDGKANNLGEFVVKKGEAKLTTSTDLHAFALMVTAEPYFAVKVPSNRVVLYNYDRNYQNGNPIRADLLPIHPNPKAPLDLYEARNAVRIARLAGAERYAIEAFRKALQRLQDAETIFANSTDGDKATIEEKSREATEAAEDARFKAVQRQQESGNGLLHPANRIPNGPSPN
jgi:hypothetical protein